MAGAHPVPSLDGVRMRAVGTAGTGQVGSDTLFVFTQSGSTVSARYAGGALELGYLVGSVTSGRLVFRYCQVDRQGEVHGGRSACDITRLPDGRIRCWSTPIGTPLKDRGLTCWRRWRDDAEGRGPRCT